MKFEKPFYTLNIAAEGCPYDIRVNDCPVLMDKKGYRMNVKIPINRWIVSGKNTVDVLLKRTAQGRGRCRTQVILEDFTGASEKIALIDDLPLVAPPLQRDEPPDFAASSEFEAEVPFPPWTWRETAPVDLGAEDRQAIVREAGALWSAFRAKDMALVREILLPRLWELRQAHYQSEAEMDAALEKDYRPHLNEWRLADFDDTGLEFQQYAHGRLVKIVSRDESPLFFIDPGEDLAAYIELIFYKSPNGWRIIR